MSLCHAENALTIQDGINGNHLAEIEKENGQSLVTKLLVILINAAQNAMNVNKMSENQVIQLACLIQKKYPNESLEDFTLCFKNGREGEFGKNYNRLDVEVIISWLDGYLDKKYYELEERKKQEFADTDSKKVEYSEGYLKVLKTVQKGLEEKKQVDAGERDEKIQRKFDPVMYRHNLRNQLPKMTDEEIEYQIIYHEKKEDPAKWLDVVEMLNVEIKDRRK